MEEGVLCCPTKLHRPLDRDQDSKTGRDRRHIIQTKAYTKPKIDFRFSLCD